MFRLKDAIGVISLLVAVQQLSYAQENLSKTPTWLVGRWTSGAYAETIDSWLREEVGNPYFGVLRSAKEIGFNKVSNPGAYADSVCFVFLSNGMAASCYYSVLNGESIIVRYTNKTPGNDGSLLNGDVIEMTLSLRNSCLEGVVKWIDSSRNIKFCRPENTAFSKESSKLNSEAMDKEKEKSIAKRLKFVGRWARSDYTLKMDYENDTWGEIVGGTMSYPTYECASQRRVFNDRITVKDGGGSDTQDRGNLDGYLIFVRTRDELNSIYRGRNKKECTFSNGQKYTRTQSVYSGKFSLSKNGRASGVFKMDRCELDCDSNAEDQYDATLFLRGEAELVVEGSDYDSYSKER